MIELRLLRYFVAVAETEHVGRASKLLHVSQSPLSRQIRQLEEATRLALFERERQRLRITTDGRWLLGRARALLAQAETLERDALRLARGEVGTLRIGFVKTAMWTALLPRALRRFRAKHGSVVVELRSARTLVQLAALRAGELDVGFVHDAPPDDGVACHVATEEPLCLALPAGHALAERRRVTPADLDGMDWIALETGLRERTRNEALLAACERRGFTPTVRFSARDQDTIIGLVAAGMGAAFLPESAGASRRAGVVLRALPWLKLSRALRAVTRVANVPRVAKEFVDCVKTVAR